MAQVARMNDVTRRQAAHYVPICFLRNKTVLVFWLLSTNANACRADY